MATGASAAKRKAKKAAAEQYYKVFKELKPANTDYKMAANNKKQITNALGDDVSYGTNRLAMQADKLGRSINKDEEYRTDLKRYNARYDALKTQLSGQDVTRYKASSGPIVEAKDSKVAGIGRYSNQVSSNIGTSTNGGPFKESPTKKGRAMAEGSYYNTAEEAMQDAQANMNQYNSSLDAKVGTLGRAGDAGVSAINKRYSQESVNKLKVSDPSKFVQEEKLRRISVGYRQLDDMESAYGEIAALSEKAGKSPVNQQAEQYAKLTEQLKQKLKREQGAVSNKPQGLLASELAGNNLLPEVIRA